MRGCVGHATARHQTRPALGILTWRDFGALRSWCGTCLPYTHSAPDVATMPAEHDAIPEHGRLDAGTRESWSRSRQARSVGSLRRPLSQDSALPASPRLRLSAGSRGGDAVVVMQDVASDGGAASVGVAAGALPSPREGFNPGSSAGAGAGGSADAIGRQSSGLSIRTSLGHEVSTEGEFKLSLSTGSRLSAASKGHSNTSSGEFHKAYEACVRGRNRVAHSP